MNPRLILIITAVIVVIIILGFLFQKPLTSPPPVGGLPQSLSSNPDYQPVKEKYNLSEEQLQILSTVNQEDNE